MALNYTEKLRRFLLDILHIIHTVKISKGISLYCGRKSEIPRSKIDKRRYRRLRSGFFKICSEVLLINTKYPNPKKYAEKISKTVQSEKDFAPLYTIAYLKNAPEDHFFKPSELNQRLANDIQQSYIDITTEMEDYVSRNKRLVSPRFLRENVLQKLEDDGMVVHLEGKKELRSYQRHLHRPGKKPSNRPIYNARGGKPSAYKVSDEVQKLKKVMAKPEALDYLCNKVIKSDLAYKLAKFNFLAFLHAAKMNKKIVECTMGVGASLLQEGFTNEDVTDFRDTFANYNSGQHVFTLYL
jgi:hypothetical protein